METATRTMKAATLDADGLAITELAIPEPGKAEALVRMSASGVCHSDLHIIRRDWVAEGAAGFPMGKPLGHEGIGIVESLGSGAEAFVSVGDRVIVGLGGGGGAYWCGACEYCLSGRPRLCAESKALFGTFSEYLPVWAPALVKLPDSISDEEAPLACGGLTAYGAVKRLAANNVQPGRVIAIVGAAGGLGHYAVQIAVAFGYRVIGIDIGEEKLDFVRSLGAELAVEPAEAHEVITRAYGGVDATLVFSSRLSGFDLAINLLRAGGLFVAVGIPAKSEGKMQLDLLQILAMDIRIIYSGMGNVQEMRELVQLASAGKVKTRISRVGALSELGTILDDLQDGRYVGRAVITDLAH